MRSEMARAAGLGVADEPLHAEAQLEAELRELRALPGARLARHHHHLVVTDGVEQRSTVGHDGQVGVAGRGQRRPSPLEAVVPGHCWLFGLLFTWALTAFVNLRS